MRHRKAGRKLKRTASHRRATLAALSTSLLRHKRITTTVAKAKETRTVVEKLITRAKKAADTSDTPARGVHARREVGRLIRDRSVVTELFGPIAGKVAHRPGGYTRIVKLGRRQGDGAELAVIELVDFNTGKEETEKPPAAKKGKKARTPKKTAKTKGGSPEATPAKAAAKETESHSDEKGSR